MQKGFKLNYLLNLSFEDKIFFKESLEIIKEEEVNYDYKKMNDLLIALGGEK